MGFVAKMFSGPKPQAIKAPDPLPPPVRADAEVAAESTADQLRKRRGRAATVLTEDGDGLTSSSSTTSAAARILGS